MLAVSTALIKTQWRPFRLHDEIGFISRRYAYFLVFERVSESSDEVIYGGGGRSTGNSRVGLAEQGVAMGVDRMVVSGTADAWTQSISSTFVSCKGLPTQLLSP